MDGTGWSAAWGVVALLFGGGAVPAWLAALAPGSKFPTWPAWVLIALAAIALYMSFAYLAGRWPTSRKNHQPINVNLIPEQVDDHLRLTLLNCSSSAAEISVQVTGFRDPLGQRNPPQSWTILWLEGNSTEPRRILAGARQVLDFARYDAEAVNAELSTGHRSVAHWWFSAIPVPIGVRYFNLRSTDDLELQSFVLDVRIIKANSIRSLDRQLTLRVQGSRLVCEIAATSASE